MAIASASGRVCGGPVYVLGVWIGAMQSSIGASGGFGQPGPSRFVFGGRRGRGPFGFGHVNGYDAASGGGGLCGLFDGELRSLIWIRW